MIVDRAAALVDAAAAAAKVATAGGRDAWAPLLAMLQLSLMRSPCCRHCMIPPSETAVLSLSVLSVIVQAEINVKATAVDRRLDRNRAAANVTVPPLS